MSQHELDDLFDEAVSPPRLSLQMTRRFSNALRRAPPHWMACSISSSKGCTTICWLMNTRRPRQIV